MRGIAWDLAAQDLVTGGRLLRDLPAYLRTPVGAEEAARAVALRLAGRETAFLALVRAAVFAHAPSPYRRLLAEAGCTAGDLEALVRRDGVDTALRTLAAAGVYLTVDEFKGRLPVRGAAVPCLSWIRPASGTRQRCPTCGRRQGAAVARAPRCPLH